MFWPPAKPSFGSVHIGLYLATYASSGLSSFASAKSPISSIANVTASNDLLRDEALRVFVAYSSAGVVTVNLILMPVSLKNCETIESAPLGNAFSNCGFAKSSVCTTIVSGAVAGLLHGAQGRDRAPFLGVERVLVALGALEAGRAAVHARREAAGEPALAAGERGGAASRGGDAGHAEQRARSDCRSRYELPAADAGGVLLTILHLSPPSEIPCRFRSPVSQTCGELIDPCVERVKPRSCERRSRYRSSSVTLGHFAWDLDQARTPTSRMIAAVPS